MSVVSRRDFIQSAVAGSLLMRGLLSELLAADSSNPLAAKPPHFPAKAKSVIFLFLVGGPSQVDLFDPKPELTKRHGQPLPESFGKPVSQLTKGDTPLLA